MSSLSQIARPYAKAVFQLAQEQSALSAWAEGLSQLAALVADDAIAALLGHPRVEPTTLVDALAPALGSGVGSNGRNFLAVLAEQGRLSAIPDIKLQFDVLRAEAERTVAVAITTAESVDTQQQGAFSDAIAKRLGRGVQIDWATDAALIGGAVIRAEDLVIDGSIRGELERLQKQIGQ